MKPLILMSLLNGGKVTGGNTNKSLINYISIIGAIMKHKSIIIITSILFSVLLVNTSNADENDSGFELVAGLGEYFYDSPFLDNAAMTVFGVGYKYNKNWQVELIRGNPDTNLSPGNGDIDVDWTALRGLYYFDQNGFSQPYISAGVDGMDVFSGEYQAVLGLGIKMKITNNLFWRLEGNYHSDEGETSLIALLGYSFGGSGNTVEKPKDSDGDGVLDNIDACPRTPSGDKVDATGCTVKAEVVPDKDSDADGVVDRLDKCPNTPRNALVDSNGCQKQLLKEVSVNLEINFDSNKDIVKSEYYPEIEAVAKFMIQYAGTSVVVEGHTDSQGKASYNEALSAKRAMAVAKLLVDKYGITTSRVKSQGFGENNPVADNNTAEGRKANRRVVAVIKQKVEEKQWRGN